jgi:hypothetical protein
LPSRLSHVESVPGLRFVPALIRELGMVGASTATVVFPCVTPGDRNKAAAVVVPQWLDSGGYHPLLISVTYPERVS